MYKAISIIIIFLVIASCKEQDSDNIDPIPGPNTPAKVLIITETKGFRHESISSGRDMFEQYAEEWGITVTTSPESDVLLTEDVNGFSFIVLLSTTGDFLDDQEQEVLKQYVLSGGGILGIHAATDAEYDWPWYGTMLGARFENHPQIQEASCTKMGDAYNSGMPQEWTRTDEWYNFRALEQGNNVLIYLDEHTYDGGTMGANHPISWYRQVGEGRVFYTGMGHTKETYGEPLFIQHIENAVSYLKE